MGREENRKAYRERHPERDRQSRREAKARWIARNPEKHAEGNRARAARYRAQFPEKVRAAQKANYEANKKERRSYWLQKKFGLTAEQWDHMFEAQGRACGCCGASDPGSAKGWQTDHCHATERVRAILCWPCNHAITEHLQANIGKIVAYLDRHPDYTA